MEKLKSKVSSIVAFFHEIMLFNSSLIVLARTRRRTDDNDLHLHSPSGTVTRFFCSNEASLSVCDILCPLDKAWLLLDYV